MSTTLSKIKLVAIGCLSVVTLTGMVNIPSASAREHRDGHENVRGDDHMRGDYHMRGSNRRLCRELRESISSLERTRERILRRHNYNPERLRWIERELRQKRAEYRRACR